MTTYTDLLERQLDEKGFGTLTKALGTWARDFNNRTDSATPPPSSEPTDATPPSPTDPTKAKGIPFQKVEGSIRQKLLATDWELKPDTAWGKFSHDQKVRVLRSTLAKTKAKKPTSV